MPLQHNHHRDEPQWDLALVRRTGFGHLAGELVDQQSRTARARVRSHTMVNLAHVLGQTGTGAEVIVSENDGSGWSITIPPRSPGSTA
ncbi:hypothetical protein LWC34_45360 [Kibdelosporangium philippinense]|uniref:Uncharacterized protein n=2 Tax=Kibdelosporangium philippinense TaxID=211113 RepID=A0ABS8ZQI7_9PSEU|nr:hypothetical protein [Kibdelosporangium philippinense]MCE7009989.1 hypothetical protein [Kibdelosporangium philippinense]